MLHYSRPWKWLLDRQVKMSFCCSNKQSRTNCLKKRKRRIHMSGSCNQSIPSANGVVYFGKPLIAIEPEAGLVRFKTFQQACVNSTPPLLGKAAKLYTSLWDWYWSESKSIKLKVKNMASLQRGIICAVHGNRHSAMQNRRSWKIQASLWVW